MLKISQQVSIPDDELDISAVRAQGSGGQNVNKVSSAVHLRFDIAASSLPDSYKQRLLQLKDQRISKDGVVVIKAQQYRSQVKNRAAALARLQDLVRSAARTQRKRKPTAPSRNAKKRRLDSKNRRGKIKALRRNVSEY